MIKDYYRLLGLPRYAPLSEVKTAYRKLAAQCHPDKVADQGPEAQEEASAKMLELNEAIALLSDPGRRAQYHQMLELIPERQPEPSPRFTPAARAQRVEPQPTPVAPPKPPPPMPEPKARRGLVGEEQGRSLRVGLRQLPLKWREASVPGWQWALEAGGIRRALLVAHRHLENLSRLSVRTVQVGLGELVRGRQLAVRSTTIIALVSYERLMDAQDVQRQLRAAVAEKRGWLGNVNLVVVLLDGKTQRTLLLGTPGENPEAKRVMRLLATKR